MKKNYYNKKYFEVRDFFPLYFAENFLLQLKSLPVKTILDVGCGTGRLIKYLNKNGFKATGCDISNEAVRISGEVKGSATNLPFKNCSFDMITAISLIEHLSPKQMDKFLTAAHRVLKPNGYLFLITPNLWSIDKLFRGKNWFGYTDPTHVQFYSPISIKKLLIRYKFVHQKFSFKVNPKTSADWFFMFPRLPQVCQFMANFLMLSTPLSYFINSFWVLSQKKT